MRAAVYYTNNDVRLEEVPKPAIGMTILKGVFMNCSP